MPRYLEYLDRTLQTTTTGQDSPRRSTCFLLPSVASGLSMVCNPPALFQYRGSAGAAILCKALHQWPHFRPRQVPCIARHPAHNRAMQRDGAVGGPKQKITGPHRGRHTVDEDHGGRPQVSKTPPGSS